MITTRIVYIFCKIIGLCPYGLTNLGTIRFSYVGALYSMILSSLYSVCYVRAITDNTDFNDTHRPPMSIIANAVTETFLFGMIITTWISFAFSQRDFRRIQKSFVKIVESCRILGIREIHSVAMKKVQKRMIIFNAIWIFLFVIFHAKAPSQFDAFIWIPYNLGRVVYPNFIILYIGIMIIIRDEFRSLNERLREIGEIDATAMTIGELIRRERSNEHGVEYIDEPDTLAAFCRLHAEMISLTRSIINLLSPSLYLTVIGHLVQLSTIFYVICLLSKNGTFLNPEFCLIFIAMCFASSVHIAGIIAEIAIADSATNEANRTGNVLHEVVILNPTKKYVDSAKIWSLRMLQEPLTIELFGIIQMKYSVVYKICGSVVGYVTVMLQLDEQERQARENLTLDEKIN